MIPGPVAVSLKGRSDTGSTAAAADAPLASDNDMPTTPNTGTTSFRCFRVEACFVFGILEVPPRPILLPSYRKACADSLQARPRKSPVVRRGKDWDRGGS